MLGFASVLMDISSEMIHSLLPLFMATTLGANALFIGFIEGLTWGGDAAPKTCFGVNTVWRKVAALFANDHEARSGCDDCASSSGCAKRAATVH